MLDSMDLILDNPIRSNEDDYFYHQDYASVLFDLIQNDKYKTSYNIGLLGDWGVGKSSIKEICKKHLENEKTIKIIDFDCWSNLNQQLSKSLMKDIFIELGGKEEKIRDTFYRQITKTSLNFNGSNEIFKNIVNSFFNCLLILVISVILVITFYLLKKFSKDILEQLILNASFSTVAIFVLKELFKDKPIAIPLFQNIQKVDLPSSSEDLYKEFLLKIIKKIDKDQKYTKIVIFIDDLDRLSPDEMIEGLKSIRLFMNMQLDNIKIVFVVSCCDKKIEKALNQSLLNNNDEHSETKNFLDKFFQFKININPVPFLNMNDYAKNLINKNFSGEDKDKFNRLQDLRKIKNSYKK